IAGFGFDKVFYATSFVTPLVVKPVKYFNLKIFMFQDSYLYDAFLSYSTGVDYNLAQKLESFLESFHDIPSPGDLQLKKLNIWRDGRDYSISHKNNGNDVATILQENLARCRYLVLLWSTASKLSYWMNYELNWFLKHRGPENILIGITDAVNPDPKDLQLFTIEIINAGISEKRWYDYRGFQATVAKTVMKLRDFDEACLQLAADLNGCSLADVQPIWWRNKLQEQQEKTEREERARKKIELAECDARIEAANGWYERAFIYFQRNRYRDTCKCLINALYLASPSRVPEHYIKQPTNPGWAEHALSFLFYALNLAPRKLRQLPVSLHNHSSFIRGNNESGGTPLICYLSGGDYVAEFNENAIYVFSTKDGQIVETIQLSSDLGNITAWDTCQISDCIAIGTSLGNLIFRPGLNQSHTIQNAHENAISFVKLATDSSKIAATDGKKIKVWDVLNNIQIGSKPLEVLANKNEDAQDK
ncbi:MAG: hypothetical protein M3Z56_10265, partial [Bacteroidota bacterium]|nr:hypothetical protein [Bacteroidota bacterium]